MARSGGLPLITRAFLVMIALSASGIPVDAADWFTLDDHRDLRPGAPILPDDWLTVHTLHGDTRDLSCTANFVFRDADGNRYIGTAGHCAPIPHGVHAWAYPEGPVALDMDRKPIGRFVYAGSTLVPTDTPVPLLGFRPEWDFALIRLDPGVPVDPQMAHFGGPTGLNEDLTAMPLVMHQYGWGVRGVNGEPEVPGCCAAEIPAHGRTFVAPSMPDSHVVRYASIEGGGDSGSPIISTDGRAVGIVSSANYVDHHAGTSGAQAGSSTAVRLGPQVAKAEDVLGIELTLLTAPMR